MQLKRCLYRILEFTKPCIICLLKQRYIKHLELVVFFYWKIHPNEPWLLVSDYLFYVLAPNAAIISIENSRGFQKRRLFRSCGWCEEAGKTSLSRLIKSMIKGGCVEHYKRPKTLKVIAHATTSFIVFRQPSAAAIQSSMLKQFCLLHFCSNFTLTFKFQFSNIHGHRQKVIT